MKYIIKIMSKTECTAYSKKELDNKCIVISINDTDNNTIIYDNPKIIDVLRFEFDDITKPIHTFTPMNLSHAKEIKAFIDKYKNDVCEIIVHCTAGISRSGAVGCCLAQYLNGDDTYLLKTGLYMPNKLVYKLLSNTLGLKYTEKIFENKIKISNSACLENLKKHENLDLENMFL